MRWSKEGWELARDVLSTTNPDIATLDVTTAYAFDYLDQLEALGLQSALGVPVRAH